MCVGWLTATRKKTRLEETSRGLVKGDRGALHREAIKLQASLPGPLPSEEEFWKLRLGVFEAMLV